MQPFRVQCETCQTPFRVRDERVVGQVHACPKCGGMVLLAPPEGFDVEKEVADGEAPVIEAAPQLSPAEARGRGVAIGVAASGLMVLGAAAAILLAIRGGDPAGEATPGEPALIAKATPPPTPPLGYPIGAAQEEPSQQAPAAEEAEPATAINKPALPGDEPIFRKQPIFPEQPAVEQAGEQAVEPIIDTTPSLPLGPSTPLAQTPAAEEPPNLVVSEPAVEEPGTIDPLDFDPTSTDLILTRGPRNPTSAPPVPKPSKQPGALLDQRIADATADKRGTVNQEIDQRLAARAADLQVWARLGVTGQTSPPIPADEALGIVVPEIVIEEWPLDRALDLLSNLGGAPITLPPAALRHAGVTADRRVTVTGRGQTLGELLSDALRPLSLECVNRGGKLIVARRGGDQQHSANYSVSDLADGNGDALLDLIRTALDLDRDGVELSYADGKLSVTAPRVDHYELTVWCEQLRQARGLALRSKYPRALLADRPALEQLAPRLDQPATFSFVRETPLRRVFAHWRDVLGAPLLVDWAALADLELMPATPVTAAARNTTWREVLDNTLGSLGLTWRAVDAGVIVITTPAGAQTVRDLSIYTGN